MLRRILSLTVLAGLVGFGASALALEPTPEDEPCPLPLDDPDLPGEEPAVPTPADAALGATDLPEVASASAPQGEEPDEDKPERRRRAR